MKFIRTTIQDVIICEPKVHVDDRGNFAETFRKDKLDEFLGFSINFCQDNQTKSSYGVLRGLHYQLAPFAQTKLVKVIKGEVLDVAVDIRKGSLTFGEYVAVKLTETNKKQLFIPRGFAHGFSVLSEEASVVYKVDNYYNSAVDNGIAFNDMFLDIDWKLPKEAIQLSQKDKQQPSFADANYFDYKMNLYV